MTIPDDATEAARFRAAFFRFIQVAQTFRISTAAAGTDLRANIVAWVAPFFAVLRTTEAVDVDRGTIVEVDAVRD